MKLSTKLLSNLPFLSWLAICNNLKKDIVVFHGWLVETGVDYCVSAVWDDDFKIADFDKADIIAGTGIRLRNETVIFVTPGITLDRIVYYNNGDVILVSSSLCAVFAYANISPIGEEERFTISWEPFKTRWVLFYWKISRMKARYEKVFESVTDL